MHDTPKRCQLTPAVLFAGLSEIGNQDLSEMSNFSTATFSNFLKPQTEPAHLLVGGGGWGEANPIDLLALHAHLQAPAPVHQERPELWGRVGGGTDAALNAGLKVLLNGPLHTVIEGDETLLSNAELGHGASLWPLAKASSLLDEAVLSTSVHLDFLKQTVSKQLYPGVTHLQPAGAVRHDTDTPHPGQRAARLVLKQQDAQEAQEEPARASLAQDLSHMTSKLEAAGSHLATDFLRGVKRLRQAAAQADDRQPHWPALASAEDLAEDFEPSAVPPGKSPHLQLSARRQQASLSALSAIEMPSRPVLPIPRPCSLVLSASLVLSGS
jgi:hypothetical protein